jgi:hypothetical protein
MFQRGDEFIDAVQTIGILGNTAVLFYIVWRFDQAIRGAEKGLRANITKLDEFREEMRLQSDRTALRVERLEAMAEELAK